MTNSITAVMWDLGGVVLAFDESITDRKLSAHCALTPEQISGKLFGNSVAGREFNEGLIEPFYLGRIGAQVFYQNVKKELGLDMSYKQFVDAWTDIFTRNEKIIAFMQGLKRKGVPQCALSSTNELHMEKMVKFAGLEETVGRARFVTTYNVGAKKPDRRLFEAATCVLQTPLNQCAYVDDIQKYIDASLKYGIGAAIHVDITQPDFQERCIADLKKLGICA
ncbi:HAD hydrolase-like protein [Candidatus Woesearchaeota archaeon]|nr:HAD hydrolase-like protein [Candidatus Woesearchaeota archaeon]